MREISLAGAIDAIRSTKHETRREGLDDLEQVLKQNRNNGRVQNLSDTDFRHLIQTLTSQVVREKESLSKAVKKQQSSTSKTSITKNTAASRLAASSHAVRLTVEIGVTSLRSKTVRELLGHIVKEVCDEAGQFSDALLDDYFKTLLAILAYRPHLEHLSDQRWSELVSLCCSALRLLNEGIGATQDGATASNRRPSAQSRHSSRASTPSLSSELSASKSQPNQRPLVSTHRRIDDVASCLEKLLSVHHLDILTVADEVLETVDSVLRPTVTSNRIGTQLPCFVVINTILFEAITENTALAERALSSALFFTRRHWGSHKAGESQKSLNDQMLISLFRGQALFPSMIRVGIRVGASSNRAGDLDGLLDRLMTEYRSRLKEDLLSSHDIELEAPLPNSHQELLSMRTCFVKNNEAAESRWTQLTIIAKLFGQLRMSQISTDIGSTTGASAKKRRLEDPLFALVSTVTTAKQEEIVASLQFLVFILGSMEVAADQLQTLVDKLFPLLTRDNGEVSNWSTLALAMIGQQSKASEAPTNDTNWQQILSISISRFSTHRVSRFSCYMADIILRKELVSFAEASDGLEGLLAAIDVSGPALLDEASSSLWRTILALYNTHRAASHDSVRRNIIRWFFATWKPSQSGLFRKRLPAVKCITELLGVLLGEISVFVPPCSRRILFALSRARLRCVQDSSLTEYLLADTRTAKAESGAEHNPASSLSAKPSTKSSRSLVITVCDYLLTEIDAIRNAYEEASQTNRLSLALVRESLTICIVAFGLHETIVSADMTKGSLLMSRATNLRDQTASAYTSPGLPADRLNTMIETLYDVFDGFKILPASSFKTMSATQVGTARVAKRFGKDFWLSLSGQQQHPNGTDDDDLMTIDEIEPSQNSQSTKTQTSEDIEHDWLGAFTDKRAYQATVRADLCLASELPDQSVLSSDEDGILPPGVVRYLTDLSPPQFLAARPFLEDVYNSKLHIKNDDGAQLLVRAAEIFELYELERCETAMGTCIDLLTYLVRQWASSDIDDDLSDAAGQLYVYFLKAVEKKVVTPHVSTAMANMLQRVIKTYPAYGQSESLPSARTVLFQILASGSTRVKFGISQTVSAVFGLFILREHDSILDDIEASIPHDPDHLAATAVRLFLLSRLAASWSTLIRRCIYSIVEATGLSPEVIPYAQSCLRYLGHQLGIQDLHQLFKLFVSQILYTWLQTRSIASLPYSIFDYTSLDQMINDCRQEVAAQMIMRGKESEIDTVTKAVNARFPDLLQEAFGKCAAYCIARDTAVAPDVDPQAANAAVRLRKHLGNDLYKTLISEQFPEIVATFFRIVDREDQITKGFQKHERHAAAHEAFESMLLSGASQNTPPVSQQPSFKSTHLLDELEYICGRSPYDLNNLWTPAVYLYVFRSLLENIQPALGPLHAAAVVRRIRILVSMGGSVATTGYCLEMALGALRPYLDNTHSAEDVMGLYRYLLVSGKRYLIDNLSFLGGFAVSVLASLKAFMDRPQESTTQESVFRATLTKAQDFHSWISQYTLEVQATSQATDAAQIEKMVGLASRLGGHGSSRSDTPEGELLFQVLRDKVLANGILDEASRKQILNIIASNFQSSGDKSQDILGKDEYAVSLAPTAWEYFQPGTTSPDFNLWIIRALGRSYASTGLILPAFRREIPTRTDTESQASTQKLPARASSVGVIAKLYHVVCNNSTAEAGIAERTMQSILTRADMQGDLQDLVEAIPEQVISAMNWNEFYTPNLVCPPYEPKSLRDALIPGANVQASTRGWAKDICLSLIDNASVLNEFLTDLRASLLEIPAFAEDVLPDVLHLVLAAEAGKGEDTKKLLSAQVIQMMSHYLPALEPIYKQLIATIIYLRGQPMPFEKTKMDRSHWLDIDYRLASEIALECKMYKTALLFLEIAMSTESKAKGSRRSSASASIEVPTEMLSTIFQSIHEKDYYYGVRQPSSLGSMMERFDFEGASFESLVFRGMAFDAETRECGKASQFADPFVRNLNDMQLSGLSFAVASTTNSANFLSSEATFDAARKLEKWDIPTPETQAGPAVNLYQAFQSLHGIESAEELLKTVDTRLESAFPLKVGVIPKLAGTTSFWSSLAVLVEVEEVLTATSQEKLQQVWLGLDKRRKWMESTSFEDIDRVLSCRETLFSVLCKNASLQNISHSTPKQVRQLQIQVLLSSSSISRVHKNIQKSLSAATAIEQLLPACHEVGLNVEAAARLEASNVLWDQGQMAPSIQILRDIANNVDLQRQDIHVGRPDVLAKLASRISEARLEQPDQILSSYLDPALKELRGNTTGEEAGQVFHEFASFCDKQLQDSDSLEDFARVQKMRDDKYAEVQELDEMIRSSSPSKERDALKVHRSKAKTWYDLDNAEYKRLQNGRDALLKQSLDMYLLCLKACDSYDRDAMRFSALWLENYDDDAANGAVRKHLSDVSSSKFASLMNQWTSRLLDEKSDFQTLLADLVVRICGDHPYHAMYNIFVNSKSRGGKDAISLSRHAAANNIATRLKQIKDYTSRWINVHNACVNYQRFAIEPPPEGGKWKQGMKCQLRKTKSGPKLEVDVVNLRVPPPTMRIVLHKNGDYKDVPIIVKWSSEFSVASGLSAPKIITAIASDGQRYKMLFKAGNDDPRQDAIMEQVFEQVSDLLQAHRETRQRKLGIRCYKVLPLTHTSGVIEFVQNTIPLHDYLLPAHQDHYPNDMKNTNARKIIQEAAQSGRGNEHRIREYRRVCDKFHPVLRFFFMERFENPDDWFEKRLAYTRTTAAISMLGHILGLGDRHGHNILLDEKTGEVVHIDLGIAFEQGRVLPVPELVPFRLTRDIVDGMGITKTEGVFRRCCEFTLDALRKESWGIMTILDVLRFDPLYSWSISPLRLRRLQADKSQGDDETEDGDAAQAKTERKDNEEAEADRALTVVNKKLSKSLSVEATVNQLIQQATDEKNLALLFAGWAAYV